jgi:outer membrane protein OmpA-like peptidoglycan-associated protein
MSRAPVIGQQGRTGLGEHAIAYGRCGDGQCAGERLLAVWRTSGFNAGCAAGGRTQGSLASHKKRSGRHGVGRSADDGSFDKGSSAIKVTIQPLLYQLSQCLGRHPEVRVNLVGYSDSSGDADFNIALSKNRARSVSEYLAAHNIDASRISVEGRGDADPVDDNGSPAGRARNRRVEIVLTQP